MKTAQSVVNIWVMMEFGMYYINIYSEISLIWKVSVLIYSLQPFDWCAPASCLPLTPDVGWTTELSLTSGPSLSTQLVVSAAVARLATGNPPPPCHGKPAQAPLSTCQIASSFQSSRAGALPSIQCPLYLCVRVVWIKLVDKWWLKRPASAIQYLKFYIIIMRKVLFIHSY